MHMSLILQYVIEVSYALFDIRIFDIYLTAALLGTDRLYKLVMRMVKRQQMHLYSHDKVCR